MVIMKDRLKIFYKTEISFFIKSQNISDMSINIMKHMIQNEISIDFIFHT